VGSNLFAFSDCCGRSGIWWDGTGIFCSGRNPSSRSRDCICGKKALRTFFLFERNVDGTHGALRRDPTTTLPFASCMDEAHRGRASLGRPYTVSNFDHRTLRDTRAFLNPYDLHHRFFPGLHCKPELAQQAAFDCRSHRSRMFEAFYGLVQYLTGWQQIFGYVKRYDLQEATGTYINRNHYAGLLEMLFPLSLALAFYELWKLHTKKRTEESNFHRIAIWLSIAVVLFAGLVYSRSRMGIAAASISVLVMLTLAWTSKAYGRIALVVCAAFLVLSIGIIAWIGAASVVERFQDAGQEYAAEDHTRVSIWRGTLRLIGEHPWFGTGFGTFPIAYTVVQTTFLDKFVNHAHNDYLELASDLGIPAAFGITAPIVWILVRTARAFRDTGRNMDKFFALGCVGSIVAILLHSLSDFNLYIPANALVFASILGLAMSLKPGMVTENR